MRILVQKFGGTSLKNPEGRRQAVERVVDAREKGFDVVVVVSAMGRDGDPYATDTLLKLVKPWDTSLPSREVDLLLSCGEVISGVVFTSELQASGVPATCLAGSRAGIITDSYYGEARILRVDPTFALTCLQRGQVAVVTGFQGVDEKGETTTLGRGGSDTTATALGVALGAEEVEIYTDVDGVKTADPNIVFGARTLDVVSYNEVCQLAHEGARVIHPRAVEIAMQGGVPLRIKSNFNRNTGTLVTAGRQLGVPGIDLEGDQPVTGIVCMKDISQVTVEVSGENIPGIQRQIFETLAAKGISLDFINVFPSQVVFTVKGNLARKAETLLQELGLLVTLRHNCAKMAVVGAGMTGRPGVMATMVSSLASQGITVLQSADSYTSIWCLIDEGDMERAACALHRDFGLDIRR